MLFILLGAGLQAQLLAEIGDDPFPGDDADKHAPVVYHGGKVLLGGGLEQILDAHGGLQRLVVLMVGDALEGRLVGVGKAVFQLADPPEQIALGDGPHIFAGAPDDGDGAVAHPFHDLQRLGDGKILI